MQSKSISYSRSMSFTTNTIIMMILLSIGYIFIIYSVIIQPTKVSNKQLNTITNDNHIYNEKILNNYENILKSKNNEIIQLQQQLNQTITQLKSNTLSSTTSLPYRPGLIILGMHRSGTSIVGGLLNKMGLKTGGPLIMPASDNEKGFFERIDVVLQNDYLMQKQHVHYAFHTFKYDAKVALTHIFNDDGTLFKEGKRGLAFLNNAENYPWMLKDPRLCITLRTWLPLLNFIPGSSKTILFTYRHPMDVALSLKTRYEHFQIAKSLKIWYIYNKRAIQQSIDLCRLITSHRLVMSQPEIEMKRIYKELHTCGVSPSHELTQSEIKDFVDVKLQHGKSVLKDRSCEEEPSSLVVPPNSWDTKDPIHIKLYQEVMRVYCAFEDGSGFDPSFKFDENIKDDM